MFIDLVPIDCSSVKKGAYGAWHVARKTELEKRNGENLWKLVGLHIGELHIAKLVAE